MPLSDAADTLRDLVDAMLSQEKVKEDRVREAYIRVNANQEEITEQVEKLSKEVTAFRDLLVAEAKSWCEGHLHRLESMERSRSANLTHQRDELQEMIDRLASHRENVLKTSRDAKSFFDIVPVSLRLLQKVNIY